MAIETTIWTGRAAPGSTSHHPHRRPPPSPPAGASSAAAMRTHTHTHTPNNAALLSNESIQEFLLAFPKSQWPSVLENIVLYGIRSLYSNRPPGTIASLQDLEEITARARKEVRAMSPPRRPLRTRQAAAAAAASGNATTAQKEEGENEAEEEATHTTNSRKKTGGEGVRKPRPDSLYQYPFVDRDGHMDDILGEGATQLSPFVFFELADREQERQARKIFEEMKRGVGGMRTADLAYALRAVGIDLSDRQAKRLMPTVYEPTTLGAGSGTGGSVPIAGEVSISYPQWLDILATLKNVFQPYYMNKDKAAGGLAAAIDDVRPPALDASLSVSTIRPSTISSSTKNRRSHVSPDRVRRRRGGRGRGGGRGGGESESSENGGRTPSDQSAFLSSGGYASPLSVSPSPRGLTHTLTHTPAGRRSGLRGETRAAYGNEEEEDEEEDEEEEEGEEEAPTHPGLRAGYQRVPSATYSSFVPTGAGGGGGGGAVRIPVSSPHTDLSRPTAASAAHRRPPSVPRRRASTRTSAAGGTGGEKGIETTTALKQRNHHPQGYGTALPPATSTPTSTTGGQMNKKRQTMTTPTSNLCNTTTPSRYPVPAYLRHVESKIKSQVEARRQSLTTNPDLTRVSISRSRRQKDEEEEEEEGQPHPQEEEVSSSSLLRVLAKAKQRKITKKGGASTTTTITGTQTQAQPARKKGNAKTLVASFYSSTASAASSGPEIAEAFLSGPLGAQLRRSVGRGDGGSKTAAAKKKMVVTDNSHTVPLHQTTTKAKAKSRGKPPQQLQHQQEKWVGDYGKLDKVGSEEEDSASESDSDSDSSTSSSTSYSSSSSSSSSSLSSSSTSSSSSSSSSEADKGVNSLLQNFLPATDRKNMSMRMVDSISSSSSSSGSSRSSGGSSSPYGLEYVASK